MWIGASDLEDEGDFVWIDGSPALNESIGWARGEPNNYQKNEDCVVINWSTEFHNSANDGTCFSSFYALCEKRLNPM